MRADDSWRRIRGRVVVCVADVPLIAPCGLCYFLAYCAPGDAVVNRRSRSRTHCSNQKLDCIALCTWYHDLRSFARLYHVITLAPDKTRGCRPRGATYTTEGKSLAGSKRNDATASETGAFHPFGCLRGPTSLPIVVSGAAQAGAVQGAIWRYTYASLEHASS